MFINTYIHTYHGIGVTYYCEFVSEGGIPC